MSLLGSMNKVPEEELTKEGKLQCLKKGYHHRTLREEGPTDSDQFAAFES